MSEGHSRLRIRCANHSDAASLLTFWSGSAKGVSVSDDLDGVTGLLKHDADSVLIAEVGAEMVGTVIAGWDGWRAHLYRLAVSPAHRRQGVASALLDAARDRLTQLGARRLDAMVRNDNPEAHLAWEANGFTAQEQWTRWIRPTTASGQ